MTAAPVSAGNEAAAQAASLPWHQRLWRRLARALARVVLGRDVTAELQAERQRLSIELSRRLGELYSLQELAHVLSASLRFDDVVAEVARYAMRALDASGAVVLLAPENGRTFDVVAAKGVLAGQQLRRVDPESSGLVLEAVRHERLELRGTGELLELFPGATAHTAVAAPLRAHGVTVGAIAVADKLVGTFTADDARLLSTAATHAAVALANARFFEMVRVGKEQWEATFHALAEGIVLVDGGGVIRRANDAMAAVAGNSVAALVGQRLGPALFGEPQSVAELIAATRAGRRAAPIVRRSARGRILRLSASPLAAGSDAAAVVVVEDVTEQKALEGQLLQSEKLASVGTMVSGVAHELNNPLTSIAGLSEFLLEQKGGEDDPAREHLRVINDQAERASRIVRNLLSFARKSPAEQAPIDLGDVAQRTVALMGYELRRNGITVETSIAPDLPPVLGNRDQLQQVMLNLLTNASHAVQDRPGDAPRRIEVSVRTAGDRVELRVGDTGVGIPAESLAQIFDPFFTTKPPGEGTGLGLFLSYGIAESHGGTLAVASQPGNGATFTLTLPADRGAGPVPAAQPVVPSGAPAGAPRRILVVDDDPAVRRLVSVLFAHDGHTVDQAADGSEGLRLALAAEYDLVISDRRAAAGAEPFLVALLRARPAWRCRSILAAAERSSGGPVESEPEVRLLRKPFNLRDLRSAASDVWEASG